MESEVYNSEDAGIATFIGRRNGTGNGQIYRLDPPYWREDRYGNPTWVGHVWVSATYALGTPETLIFESDSTGDVLDWVELPGSFVGDLDHGRALEGLGYEVR